MFDKNREAQGLFPAPRSYSDPMHRSLGYAESHTQHVGGIRGITDHLYDVIGDRCSLRRSVTLTSPLTRHICHVVRRGTLEQMSRLLALRTITSMQSLHAIQDRTTEFQLQSVAARHDLLAVCQGEEAVSLPISRFQPVTATRGRVRTYPDAGPVPLFRAGEITRSIRARLRTVRAAHALDQVRAAIQGALGTRFWRASDPLRCFHTQSLHMACTDVKKG
jgi:hypothetical protein